MNFNILVLMCFVMIGLTTARKSNSLDVNQGKKSIGKPGYFENCGNNATEAYIRYKPGKLRFGDTMHINVHVIPPVTMYRGYLQLFVYDPEISMVDPVVYSDTDVQCSDIHKYFLRNLCPFQKGVPVDIKNLKKPVPPSFPIPTGTYIVEVRVANHKGGDELMCLRGVMTLLDS